MHQNSCSGSAAWASTAAAAAVAPCASVPHQHQQQQQQQQQRHVHQYSSSSSMRQYSNGSSSSKNRTRLLQTLSCMTRQSLFTVKQMSSIASHTISSFSTLVASGPNCIQISHWHEADTRLACQAFKEFYCTVCHCCCHSAEAARTQSDMCTSHL